MVPESRIRRFDYHSARFFCCDPGSCLVEGLAADWPHRAVSLFKRLSIAGKLNPAWLEQHLSGTAGGIFLLLKGIAGGLFGFLSWLMLSAYFILDGERAFHCATSLFPSNRRSRLESHSPACRATIAQLAHRPSGPDADPGDL